LAPRLDEVVKLVDRLEVRFLTVDRVYRSFGKHRRETVRGGPVA
jgi:hypothetical protein